MNHMRYAMSSCPINTYCVSTSSTPRDDAFNMTCVR